MNRLRNVLILIPALFFAFSAFSTRAEGAGESDASWHTIDGGGAVSAGETYRVSGSTGQPDAGNAGSGGYGLAGGFWGGIGAVGPVTPIPTETPVSSPTPSPTDTVVPVTPTSTSSQPTPTVTPTPVPGDTNGDGQVDALDLFYFSKYWGSPAAGSDPRCNPVSDGVIDEKDLLSLTREWN